MTSSALHILAMIFMLIDHVGAVLYPQHLFLRCIGRLAFPIYAFMIVEGFKHTRDIKKYILRMVGFALISEVPYNLLVSRSIQDPSHQNVLWTFLIALGCMWVLSQFKENDFKYYITVILVLAIGYYVGVFLKTDYKGAGVLMVLTFYLFNQKWIQLLFLYLINGVVMNSYILSFGSLQFGIQTLAVFSLLFIWLYNGKKGIKSKPFQYFCYAFYPMHMMFLVVSVLF